MSDLQNILVLTGADGEEIRCEFLDLIDYLGKHYAVLDPVDEDDGQVVIMQLDESNPDEESYLEVDDDSIVQAVFQLFKEKNKEYYDFSDSDNTKTSGGKKMKVRARLGVLFIAWIGAWAGLHLNWMGYHEAASDWRRRMGGLFCLINPVCWIMHRIEVFKVLFGGYRQDAYGRPIRYFSFLRKVK